MPDDVTAEPNNKGVLAGEYVLGTLDADERAAAQNLFAEDADFTAKVKVWERRLGELHLMVEPIEPEPDLWARIKARLPEPAPALEPEPQQAEPEPQQPEPAATLREPGVTLPEPGVTLPEFKFDFDFTPKEEWAAKPELPPAPTLAPEPAADFAAATDEQVSANKVTEPSPADLIALPSLEAPPSGPAAPKAVPEAPDLEAPAMPPASTPAPLPSFIAPKPRPAATTVEIEQKVRSLRRHLVGWRVFAGIMVLALLALAGLVAVWRYAPERVPPELRPVALMRLAGISVDTGAPSRKPLPPESQFDE